MGRSISFGPAYPIYYPDKFRTFEEECHVKDSVWRMDAIIPMETNIRQYSYLFSNQPNPEQYEAARACLAEIIEADFHA